MPFEAKMLRESISSDSNKKKKKKNAKNTNTQV